MKTIVAFAFLACAIILVSAEKDKKCKGKSDCDEDECCTRIVSFLPSRCQKMKKEGEFCLTNIFELREGDVYRFSCPCAGDLECKPSKETDENNVVNFLKDKCQAKE
ncbi:toxin CSTX-20-like [Parasteatoda tepidariorum]|uniref:toxin CSTX-20-like n=1 Tax=Parasteatoda tepidariorum TaxID=114398 RepID=UPI00077FCD57|nr:toxin CSTX-20-like [Parasteatoda tepidariorum]